MLKQCFSLAAPIVRSMRPHYGAVIAAVALAGVLGQTTLGATLAQQSTPSSSPSLTSSTVPAATPDMMAPDMMAPDMMAPDMMAPDMMAPTSDAMAPATSGSPVAVAPATSGATNICGTVTELVQPTNVDGVGRIAINGREIILPSSLNVDPTVVVYGGMAHLTGTVDASGIMTSGTLVPSSC